MEPFNTRKKKAPEKAIQLAIIAMLEKKSWFCKSTHGSVYQSGFPDVYACHQTFGARWIEVKNKEKYQFTAAQLKDFHMMNAHGVGIWVLSAATEEEYKKLFGPQNWYTYLI